MSGAREFNCYSCGHVWSEPYGTGRPMVCPSCGSVNIHRSDRGERGLGRGPGVQRRTGDGR